MPPPPAATVEAPAAPTAPALATPAAAPERIAPLSTNAALALQGSVLLVFLAASTAPSPLYAVYRQLYGFSAVVLTGVFACYAVSLLGALLLMGRLSDHLGRRQVTAVALVLELGAMWLFREAGSVGDLFLARSLQGLATGIAMSAVGASLIDLHPLRGALWNSLAPMFGMAAGALGSAALLQWQWHPLQHVYDGLAIVMLLQCLLMAWLPETAARRPGAWASLRPRVGVPHAARATMRAVLPVNIAQWALGGFFMSLGPSLVLQMAGPQHPWLGGALIALLVLSGAVAILWLRLQDPARALRLGAVFLSVGLSGALLAMALQQTPLLFGSTAVAGIGFGAAFNGSVRRLAVSVGPDDRASLMASFLIVSYLAFALPVMAAGLAVTVFGLQAVALVYGAALLCLTAGALLPAR